MYVFLSLVRLFRYIVLPFCSCFFIYVRLSAFICLVISFGLYLFQVLGLYLVISFVIYFWGPLCLYVFIYVCISLCMSVFS